ncbi:hypothetical protein A2U01_0102191, partial [Trifolium medium]|nr:hypothetical protein [Trifolium medium]
VVCLARSAKASEGWRTETESFQSPSEKQRALSLRVALAGSVTTQEHARSLRLATRLAQRPCPVMSALLAV